MSYHKNTKKQIRINTRFVYSQEGEHTLSANGHTAQKNGHTSALS